MQTLSIIIVHWNSESLLKKQLDLLAEFDFEIVVVNNASKVNLIKIISSYKNVRIINNIFNQGFARACNQGVLLGKSDWVLFLNPDVFLCKSDVKQMVVYANNHLLDAVSSYDDSKNYHKPIPSLLSLLVEFTFLKHIIPTFLFRQKTLVGGVLLVKKKVLMKIGGWDERFFLWFEDSDLTKKLLDNNYTIGFKRLNINHLGGASIKKITYDFQKAIFFNSMKIYSDKYFNKFSKLFINLISRKYSKYKLLP